MFSTTRSLTLATLALAAVVVFATRNASSEEHGDAPLMTAPKAVQDAFHKRYPGADVDEVKHEKEDGISVYEIEFELNGAESEVEYRADGTQLGSQDVPFSSMPDAVQQRVQKAASGATITKCEREVELRVVRFECEWKSGDAEVSAKLDAHGTLLELERTVAAEALPAEVLAAVNRHMPRAKIGKAERVDQTFYEISMTVNGKKRELAFYADGELVNDDADAEDHEDEDEDEDEDDDDERSEGKQDGQDDD